MEALGFLAGCLTLFTYVPQATKTIKTKKTRDISMFTLVLLVSGALAWVVYGIGKHLPAVWITNSIVSLLGLIILSIKFQNINT